MLPAFLPTVPGLIERLGSGDTMALVSSMNVGAHLVDISPLSTTGALCLAAAALGTDNRLLFNKLLAWGLSMTSSEPLSVGCFLGCCDEQEYRRQNTEDRIRIVLNRRSLLFSDSVFLVFCILYSVF